MREDKIRAIPKYILKRIEKEDAKRHPAKTGDVRFYAYLTKNDGELVKVTVAVKHKYKKFYCKQVAVHGIDSERCFLKDIIFYYIGGYSVGWYAEGLQKAPKWYESPEWDWNVDKMFDPYAPVINKEYIAKFPEYKYSAFEFYSGHDVLQYLRQYEKYPHVEYMMKIGLESYIFSKMIMEKAKKDKRFRKWLAKNREMLGKRIYYISTIMLAYKTGSDIAEAQAYEEAKKTLCRDKDYAPIRELFCGKYEKIINYVAKQKTSLRNYLDYLKACNFLGIDMSEDKNRIPHDFKHWHDVRADEYKTAKAIADAEKRKELYESFSTVAEKYLSLQKAGKGVFVAVLAKSPAELMAEGEALHHCVGGMGYDQKFIREETLIFFIRNATEPNVPLVTVEYSLKTKKVLQCYGEKNQKPSQEIEDFVHKKWLPHANRALKKLAA